ncbi:MAG: lipocalin family protein [Desulfomicrobium apsheronum]|nr:lipocalin family protein [Desulfomicrobium apsheronum]
MKTLVAILALLLGGCVGMPDTVRPVGNFQLERYLGTWYEIARLDHSFERDLSRVSAEYSLREDGGVRVVNRGYNTLTGKWEQAEGKAFFVENPQTGFLKVSFFGPFYGAYVIFELDHEGYSHAVVSGPDTSYLWILARGKRLDDALRRELVAKAAARGFDTSALIFVEHEHD